MSMIRLASNNGDDAHDGQLPTTPAPLEIEDGPFRVELYDPGTGSVVRVLALTASLALGHAAFYAAAREHIDEHIRLTGGGCELNRWPPNSN